MLLKDCPNASVVVHSKGKRHLADPSRLIAGARAVYGQQFDTLFDPIVPIPEERLIAMDHLSKLHLSDSCTLTFYDSPGHANHHFSIFHSKLQGIFTGDTAGVFYPQLLEDNIELYLPSTSPNQFDPNKMLSSIELYRSLSPKYIFFGHYGMSENPNEVFTQVINWLPKFLDTAQQAILEVDTFEEQVKITANLLINNIQNFLNDKGIKPTHKVYKVLNLDMEVCAMGLVDYFQRKNN